MPWTLQQFTTTLHKAHRSTRGERYRLPRSFLIRCITLHLCGLLDARKYVRAFESLLWTSRLPEFLLNVLVNLLFASTGITASGSCYVKLLSLIAFDNRDRVSHHMNFNSGQMKKTIQVRILQAASMWSVLWRWDIWGNWALFCPNRC